MGRRSQHTREQLREMSITAAELILVREGHAALSMRKVAEAIGYTVGQLYLLFENQDELLAILNERTADAVQAHLQDAAETERAPLDQLRQIAAAYIDFAHQHPHRFRLLFEHPLPQAHTPRASADRRIERLFALVEEAMAPLLPDLDAQGRRAAAATLWSGVHGICMLAVSGRLHWSGLADFRPFSDSLVSAYIAGRAVIEESPKRHAPAKAPAQARNHDDRKVRKEKVHSRRR